MLKRILVLTLLFSLVAALPALAQEYRGNFYLKVVTGDGAPIVGAKVTVSGIGATRTEQTNDKGEVRFIKLEPGSYTVEVSKDGFNTLISQGVQINTGSNTEDTYTLDRTEVVEEVVVTARTPLLDKRKTGTNTVINPQEINKIPTARDPWAVMSTIPGLQTDRINVGGNQSGQQSGFVGKGDDGDNATWVMDGVEFTDLAAQGGSSTYFDFNSFQEIGFQTGGGDLEQLTPGQRLSFTTKQGTNRHTGSLGLLLTDEAFQDGLPTRTDPDGSDVRGNEINEVFEKTFEIGGPIQTDTAYYWFGFSQNDIDNRLPGAGGLFVTDRTKLQNVTGKINATLGNTSLKGFYTRGDKVKIGRNAGPDRPQPTSWDQSGPTPIYTFDVGHFFTQDIEVSGQYSHVGGGFQLIPQGTANQIRWDNNFVWQDTYVSYITERPTDQYALRGNWFVETGNVSHEFKFGFKYKEGEVQSFSGYGLQNVIAVEWAGEAWLLREGSAKEDMEYTSFWVGDTILAGNWTFNVGGLYMTQEGTQLPSVSPGNGLCPACLEPLNVPSFNPGFEWKDFMPRGGITYTFDTARRQLIRLNYSNYVDQLAAGDVAYNHTGNPSEIDYLWNDLDGDLLVDVGEFDPDCVTGPIFVGNTDPCNTGAPVRVDYIDPNLEAPQVDELILGYEIEVAKDFTIGVNATSRKRDRELWAPLVDLTLLGADFGTGNTSGSNILTSADWSPAGSYSGTIQCDVGSSTTPNPAAPCEVPVGTPFSVTAWRLNDAVIAAGRTDVTRPQVLSNRPGFEEEYEGFELIATKRLSNKWMLRGFFSWQDWTKSFDCTTDASGLCISGPSIQRPANLVGDTTRQNSDVLIGGGTSSGGFSNVYLGSAEWQYNINGLYQLPKNFTIAANLQGREGYALPMFLQLDEFDDDGILERQGLQIGEGTFFRLDDINLVDLRLGYLLQLEGGTTVDLSFEVFNMFDEDTILQVQRRHPCFDDPGDADTLCNSGGVGGAATNLTTSRTSGNLGTIFETLSPRIFRLGAKVTFK